MLRLYLLVGAVSVALAAVWFAYSEGKTNGRNACVAESAAARDALVAERVAENVKLKAGHRKAMKKLESDRDQIAKDLDASREEATALQSEISGRGASIADQRAAACLAGLRRLDTAITGRSGRPAQGVQVAPAGGAVDVQPPARRGGGIHGLPDGVHQGPGVE